jgi:hypothetical protein
MEKIIERIKRIIPGVIIVDSAISQSEGGAHFGRTIVRTPTMNGEYQIGFVIYSMKPFSFTLTDSDSNIISNIKKYEDRR